METPLHFQNCECKNWTEVDETGNLFILLWSEIKFPVLNYTCKALKFNKNLFQTKFIFRNGRGYL